ncbi:unnamed protein product [Alternaria alternata]
MNVSHYTNKTKPILNEKERSAVPNMYPPDITTHPVNVVVSAQLDGANDHCSRMTNSAIGHTQHSTQHYFQQQHQARIPLPSHNVASVPPPRQPARVVVNAVNGLLPYCTTEPPLDEAQVIALSDVVGSLRELATLALGAASGAAGCMKKLEGAVGPRAAGNIAEFFADEWEIEG